MMMIGKIYIIKSSQTNRVYVGSTVQSLNERFSKHKSDKNCTSREILKYSDAEIELLECYECENLEQLRWIEAGYRIKTAITDEEAFSIDTPEDLEELLKSGAAF